MATIFDKNLLIFPALLILLGSLLFSVIFGTFMVFLVGYPLSLVLMGMGDPDRGRGTLAIATGTILSLILAATIIYYSR